MQFRAVEMGDFENFELRNANFGLKTGVKMTESWRDRMMKSLTTESRKSNAAAESPHVVSSTYENVRIQHNLARVTLSSKHPRGTIQENALLLAIGSEACRGVRRGL